MILGNNEVIKMESTLVLVTIYTKNIIKNKMLCLLACVYIFFVQIIKNISIINEGGCFKSCK